MSRASTLLALLTLTSGVLIVAAPHAASARRARQTNILPPPVGSVLDFDGDGRSDFAVTREVGGNLVWYVKGSGGGMQTIAWGLASDTPVPADYDGDLQWDYAVWRSGAFYIRQSSNNQLRVVPWGTSGDIPINTQDYDADGLADPTVVRASGGHLVWYIRQSSAGFRTLTFGDSATDFPICGDFDGDRKADIAVYRYLGSPLSTYFILRSSDGQLQAKTFGNGLYDRIVSGDFDGDGKTDYAVWRGIGVGGNGYWYWIDSSDQDFHAVQFGLPNIDLPVPGNYDGDRSNDPAVWRSGASALFYVDRSQSGFLAFPWGTSGDEPLAFRLFAR